MGAKYVFNPLTGNLDTTDVVAFNGEVNLGTAAAPSVFFTGDTNTGIYSPGADQVAISTNGTGRLFVDANGNVGIGTAPGAQLDILSSGFSNLRVRSSATNSATINLTNSARNYSFNTNSGDFYIRDESAVAERLRITSAGLVGIGTSSPGYQLEVSSGAVDATALFNSTSTNGSHIRFARSGAVDGYLGCSEGFLPALATGNIALRSQAALGLATGGANTRLYISSTGAVGIGTTSPSAKLEVIGDAKIGETSYPIRFATSASTGVIEFPSTSSRSVVRTLGATPLEFEINSNPVARFDTSGRLGIGTQILSERLSLNEGNALGWNDSSGNNKARIYATSGEELRFERGSTNSRSMTIDSSGRLLVGTSSAQTIGNSQAQIEVSTDSASGYALSLSRSVTDIYGPQINFRSTRGTAASPVVVNDNDQLGSITFYGYDGTDSNHQFASITALVDGTPGNNDCPGRLVFSTTADGASSPTERMRITSDAYVRLASGTGGIQFNGDTAAANALDDYEEGTWTVSVADANTGGNVSATTATAHYTKIGRFVECIFDVNNIDTTGLTAGNDIYIRGFPFAWDVVAVRGQGSVHVHNITFTGYLTLEATGGHTTCRITENASNSGVDFIMVSELSSGSARIAGRISGIV